jgi:two-component system, cell cycle response regulator CtrA
VLKQLRVAKVNTPVLILSGICRDRARSRAFGFGADDYMTKPFHKDELIARIHAVVRRSKGHAQSSSAPASSPSTSTPRRSKSNGQRVHLTGKEYQMLELLSLRKGTTLTKEMFLNHLYGGMDEPELKIIDVFICKLRKKLARQPTGGQAATSKPSGAAAMCCAIRASCTWRALPSSRSRDQMLSNPCPTPPR